MDPTPVPAALPLGALLAASLGALVAAGDAAMGALPPGRLAALHDKSKSPYREHLARYSEGSPKVLGRWLVVRILASCVAGVLTREILSYTELRWQPVIAVVGALLVCAILAEIAAAIARPRAASLGPRLLRILRPIEILVIPLADPLSAMGRAIASVGTREGVVEQDPRLTESEVEHLVEDAAKAGELDAEPAEMIRNVLDFKDLTVRDVMVPRTKVVGIEVSTPLADVLELVVQEAHSRFPVYATKIDNVVGILYVKDVFRAMQAGKLESTKLSDLARAPVNFIPETQPVSAVLRDMRSRRQHMAVLVDEYGGVSGLVTLEDILEQIVGDIRDEYDPEEAPIMDLGAGHLLADAAVSLADLSAYLGREIEGDGDYGSLGGLLTHEAGKVPSVGDHIMASGLEFIVRDSDAKKIMKVEIVLPPPSSGPMSAKPPVPSSPPT